MKNQSKLPCSCETKMKLHNFVRSMGYKKGIKNTALHIYFQAMPELEMLKSGLCQSTTATYVEIAEYADIAIPSIKAALDSLSPLCEIDIGQPVAGGSQATRFRRFTIDELKSGKTYKKLKDERPQHALKLQDILNNRSFFYGASEITPSWGISHTGRLCSSNPNIQSDSKEKRRQSITSGLRSGEVVFDIDYRRAEPTIIQHAAGYIFDCDPYDKLKDILDISRDDAKAKLNSLNYVSTAPESVLERWSPVAKAEFSQYAKALQALKEKLWIDGNPQNGKRRFVKTLCGSIIESKRCDKTHRGKILCWLAQGTVADIINEVCLEVVEQEQRNGWRLMFPVHDSAYIIGKPEHDVNAH